jgi:quinoprotein glucose dehydrogenase
LAARLGIAEVGTTLRALFAAADESGETRADALLALSSLPNEDVAPLITAGLADRTTEVRGAARQLLVKSDPTRGIAELERAVSAPERTERQAAVAQLAELKQAEATKTLSRIMDQLLNNKVPEDTLLDVLAAAGSRADDELQGKLKEFESRRGNDGVAAKFRETLQGGDAERGRTVFFERTEASCVRCHKIDSRGGEVGPDLSKIAADKTRQYLLEALVDPNRAIAKGFESTTIADADGRIHVGVVKMEDDQRIQIATADGKTVTIEKKDIDDRQPARSPMPEDIVQKLSKFDIRDLVEFLSQQK